MASRRPRKPPAGEPAAELIPPRPTLPSVRKAAEDCRACELWEKGTQTVFGEGSKSARLMLIGEQPGDGKSHGDSMIAEAGNTRTVQRRRPMNFQPVLHLDHLGAHDPKIVSNGRDAIGFFHPKFLRMTNDGCT